MGENWECFYNIHVWKFMNLKFSLLNWIGNCFCYATQQYSKSDLYHQKASKPVIFKMSLSRFFFWKQNEIDMFYWEINESFGKWIKVKRILQILKKTGVNTKYQQQKIFLDLFYRGYVTLLSYQIWVWYSPN